MSAHQMIAGFTRAQEFELEDEEAKRLAKAAANVARHYNLTASSKAVDWTNLAMTLGAIYGTRFAAIRLRRIMERANVVEQEAAPRPSAASPQQPVRPGTTRVHITGIGDVEVPLN